MLNEKNSNDIVHIQDQNNTKKQSKFVLVASKRTSNVLHNMDILRRCFDHNTYDYTPDQVTKILGALEEKTTEIRLAAESGSSRKQFSL